MKIIFIQSHNGGRLANQLWNFVSIYAFCLEKGYILINPTFKDYSIHFAEFQDNSLLSPNLRIPKILNKDLAMIALNLSLKINSKIRIGSFFQTGEDSNPIILPPTNSDFKIETAVAFFNGWLFRNTNGLEKYKDQIRYKFRPNASIQIAIDEFYKNLDPNRFKIAIHVRRTDYKQHLNGKYFFEIRQYKKVMKDLKEEFKDRSPIFIIFSDENRSQEEFLEFSKDEVILSKNSFVADLFLISRCDLIVGPPSSFTQFAAWYGDKDLRPIEDINS